MLISELRIAVLAAAAALALGPLAVPAQSDFEAYPLRPPDTSSPRATLSTFIAYTNAAYQAIDRGDFAESSRIRGRLVEMLDFSETVDGNDYEERTRRLAYLKEILDRIEIPPYEAIPGPEEVAEGDVARWTIPDTAIQVVRVEEGERAGQYVFSAGTVARLRRYYVEASHLPYKPGASIGLLEFVIEADAAVVTADEGVRERLKPPRASSPRVLLQQFLLNVNAAHALMVEAQAAFEASPPTMTREEVREAARQAERYLDRAIALLDLREVPEALRDNVGIETALLLKEIIDRTALPRIESIPSVRQVALRRQENGGAPVTWVYPNTAIETVELTEGLLKGEFRFSASTVRDAEAFYQAVRDLPYRDEAGTTLHSSTLADYESPDLSKGIYEYYISTPGTLVPGASSLGVLLTSLPPWLTAVFGGQTVWQWIGVVLSAGFALVAFYAIYRLGRLLTRRLGEAKRAWILIAVPLVNALVAVRIVQFVDKELNTTGFVVSSALAVGTVLLFVFFASAAYRLSVAIGETIVASPRIIEGGFDASLVRIGLRAVGFIAAVTLVVQGVQRAGADVVPLLAGLGVGGLAVALAVRPTLENMIGGLILYADRPIRLGDFCTFGGQSGFVERIGLRSTRIRALDRTLVTIPNAVFADMQLVNYAHCDKMLIETVIGLRYETTPEQLRHVLARMRQICLAHPKVETDTLRVRFGAFGASSLDVNVRVYALTNEWNEYHAIREDLYMRFMDAIEASGTGVAFPSSTVYLTRDAGLDADRTRTAEEEVSAWRAADELPFPHMPEPLATRLADSGDYPPIGSPEAGGKAAAVRTDESLAGPKDEGESVDAEPQPQAQIDPRGKDAPR